MKKLLTTILFVLCLLALIPFNLISAGIGVGVSTSIDEELEGIKDSGHSLAGYEKSVKNQETIEETQIWAPTDYSNEDIKGNYYTVQLGDTLWEIAEGYYGDGNMWTTILQKNSSKIGFLPSGEQALIEPGQLLEL